MQSPADNSPPQRSYADDEIDLFELIENLWKQKLLIILVTLIVAACGAAYALLATPTYQSTAYLLPPSSKNMAELNKLKLVDESAADYSTRSVFDYFLQTLQSNTARQALFNQPDVQQHFLEKTDGNAVEAWKLFNEAISVSPPKKDGNTASVSVKTDAAQPAAQWANEYVRITAEQSRENLAADLREEIQSRVNKLEQDIQSRRMIYQSQIDTELNKLTEALSIAQSLKLTEPLRTDTVIDEQSNMMVDEIRRLYRLGSNALEAEIAAISERRKNEAFIPDLTNLELQKNLLEALKVDPESIQPVRVDLEALPDDKPIKPKKLLIVALATVLGGMMGIMIALVRMAIRNRCKPKAP
ncbi:LPS O-antigen chain length determinant protein WzzB [Marinobacterium sp. YM272]|uniref:LPS O-antigen chain length determinant protein WzzB n=1 Tax=Marinobacterium sp. YM272 TaxID=3421654 RepID=UPI003D7F3B6B